MSDEQKLEVIPPAVPDEAISKTRGIVISARGLDYVDVAGLWRIAKMIHVAKLCPRGLETPEAICIAIAKGRSVGITDPFQAVESVAVINGKACLFGDAPLAIARQNPHWQEKGFEEYWEVAGKRIEGKPKQWTDDATAVCVTQRKHGKPRKETFSVADAKLAHLWGKTSKDGIPSPWITYPARMLMFRARGFNLRDNFGDSLKGLAIQELYEGDEITNGNKPAALEELNQKVREAQIPQEPEPQPQPVPPPEQPPEPQHSASYDLQGNHQDEPPQKPLTNSLLRSLILQLIPKLPLPEERKAYKKLLSEAKTTVELKSIERQIQNQLKPKGEENEPEPF